MADKPKYHVNPRSGEPGECKPEMTGICKFAVNGINPPHYEDAEDAREAYAKNANRAYGSMKTMTKKGAQNKRRTIEQETSVSHVIGENHTDREGASDLVQEYWDQSFAHHIELPEPIERVFAKLDEIGTPLLVGGSVRDSLAGKDNKDFDVEVYGVFIEDVIKKLKKSGYSVEEVGKQYGVLKVSGFGAEEVDVSVPRTENKTGAGHRNFEVYMDKDMTIEDAVQRRDFTFNAMLYDRHTGRVIDTLNGKDDLEKGVLQHVSEKFAEDPLRVMRGAQFAARFNASYTPETAAFTRALRSEYDALSIERVRDEWGKFFTKGENMDAGLRALQESGWDDGAGSSVSVAIAQVRDEGLIANLPGIEKDRRQVIGSAIIASRVNNADLDKFVRSSVISKQDVAEAKFLAERFSPYRLPTTKKDLNTTEGRKHFARDNKGVFTFHDLSTFAWVTGDSELFKLAEDAKSEGLEYKPESDFIWGKDLIEAGVKPGASMGRILDSFRNEQYRGDYKNREEALAELKKRASRRDGR